MKGPDFFLDFKISRIQHSFPVQEIVFDTAVFTYELTYDNKSFLEAQAAKEGRSA